MALRSFTGPDGATWEVWDVAPRTSYPHRRIGDRRSPDPVLLYKGPERRQGERRTAAPRIAGCAPGLEGGWLVFASGGVKRRLAPTPAGWETCPESALARLLERAR
jgi:hypothetical protein